MKEKQDPLDNVYKRLKIGGDYDSVDFSFEESDTEGAILNVKFNNTSKTIKISDDEKSIVTEFLSDSKPEPDSEAIMLTPPIFHMRHLLHLLQLLVKKMLENFLLETK